MMMGAKKVGILVVTYVASIMQVCPAAEQGEAKSLQVYLPRKVTVKEGSVKLSHVGILRGEESLVAKAGEIRLGQLSTVGQKMVVSKQMVMSRLACSGIPSSLVKLTGADEAAVSQLYQIIAGEKFVEQASAFFKEHLPDASICRWEALRTPKQFVVPEVKKEVEFQSRLINVRPRNRAKVQVAVVCDGKEMGMREVAFRLKYTSRRVVTKVDVARGEVIGPEKVRVETAVSDFPEPANWSVPYGLIARRRLPANTMIQPNMLESKEPAFLIEKKQKVMVRISSPGFFLTTAGMALEKGRAGDYIRVRVRITDTARIITAKINEDGTVQPVY